ncbi:hypothetical protein HaLaN_06892 [Haematococcus lacustris]|uniref:Uncharacterized protein n=1 Tax=Haematococcus lacustris TaxID=44745 RepID=A0A699YPB7_HAELA|nr:hypothetical protein HaLaN_06892 [Haematococcus lacustris]
MEEAAASMSQQQWGTCKQLVVFFGNAGIGTRGGNAEERLLSKARSTQHLASRSWETERPRPKPSSL